MIRNIMFDLDGTLIDSHKDIIDCLKKAYSVLPEFSDVEIGRKEIGPPLSEIIKSAVPEIDKTSLEKIIKKFRGYYDKCNFTKTKTNEGVRSLLEKLCSLDLRLFIATNKPLLPTKLILRRLNIDVFEDIVTPDKIKRTRFNKTGMVSYLISRWKLKKAETLMVGDSASDVIAAHGNGIISVVLSGGYGNINHINKSNPKHTINKIKELYALIKKIN